ncbi:MAG: putative Ig domain-containing protein, partial [Planctomycetes bacterium]|nr:putative Ig domain-containing protein [Planctomycetota bacterium]
VSSSAGWLSIDPMTGVLSGSVPAGDLGVNHQITVELEDRIGTKKQANFQLAVVDQLEVVTTNISAGEVGASYRFPLVAGGGTAPYFWEFLGGTRPIGISLHPVTGELRGAPYIGEEGSYAFTVRCTDSGTQSIDALISMQVLPRSTFDFKITTAASDLPALSEGASFDSFMSAHGGTPPYTWTLISNNLPTGMALAGDGSLNGVPVQGSEGRYTLKFRVVDAQGSISVQTITVDVSPEYIAPAIGTLASLPNATEGVTYTLLLEVTNGQAPYVWSIASGALPQGLNLNVAGGSITGALLGSTAGTYNFDLRVTDALGQSSTKSMTMIVSQNAAGNGFQVLTSNADLGTASSKGIQYSRLLSVQGGVPPLTWTLQSGALPSGIQLTSYGAIVGKATANSVGNYSFQVQVQDAVGNSTSKVLSMSVAESAVDNSNGSNTPEIGIEALPQSGGGGCSISLSNLSSTFLLALLLAGFAIVVRRKRATS